MQHLEGSGTPVLYIGRTVLKEVASPHLTLTHILQAPLEKSRDITLKHSRQTPECSKQSLTHSPLPHY